MVMLRLAGHILRSNNSDPLRGVSYAAMNVILRSATMGKEEWRVPGNGGYCILAGMLRKKLKEERSRIQWNKITNCWNLQEAVNFEYC